MPDFSMSCFVLHMVALEFIEMDREEKNVIS